MLSKLKGALKRHPLLATVYHQYRISQAKRYGPWATPYGFKLMGRRHIQRWEFGPGVAVFLSDCLDSATVCIDVGGYIGLFTLFARSLNKYVIAVEPLVQNMEWLCANLMANGWTDVEVVP